MAKTKGERWAEIHSEAIREFDRIYSTVKDEREQCRQDRRFYSIAGAQWEGNLGEQFENKPRLEVNKIHLSLIRIFSEARNNPITVDFLPSVEAAEGADVLADACDGLFRATEDNSSADEAYDNAFEEAVGGGFGAWRLRAEYEDESDPEDERQRICIEPIYDADTCVFFDINAQRQDKRDARSCFVLTGMDIYAYKEEYGDNPQTWPRTVSQSFDWVTDDKVYIAEVYRVEETKDAMVAFRLVDGSEESHLRSFLNANEDFEKDLLLAGAVVKSSKPVKTRRVRKWIMNGAKILEDCGYIAGGNIPIVPIYGKRWYVDGIERCMGHVRLAKDAQRLKNMQLSKLAEVAALSSVSKPIFTPEQVVGHETMWAGDNVKDYPFLLLNSITDAEGNPVPAGPVGYTKPAEIPPATAALLGITEADMKEVLGNQQAGEVLQPNLSGKAVELIQAKLDMQVFIYLSNRAKAMRRCGEIWLGMARELFVEADRKMEVINEEGEQDSIRLQEMKYVDGVATYVNDLSKAKFKVKVSVGPSTSSKRAATVRALTGMMGITSDPETTQVLGAMAMMNMEGEGIEDGRQYFRKKLIRMGVVKPSEKEREELLAELKSQPPDANIVYLQAEAQNAQAKAKKAEADTLLSLAKTAQTRADTAKIVSDISSQRQSDIITGAKALREAATALQPEGDRAADSARMGTNGF